MIAIVRGYCPACGLGSLVLGDDNRIVCVTADCSRRDAVDKILDEGETEHIVRFEERAFSVKHPLRERVEDDLFTCTLHTYLASLPVRPVETSGVYRVVPVEDGFAYARLGD